MTTAIEVQGLRKSYGGVQAVRGIDFAVSVGGVFALLGPNGAGKTTTVEILEGYRSRDAGEVSVLGHDPARGELELKKEIGIVLQSTGLDRFLTAAEVVDLYRSAYPNPRARDEVLEVVGLYDKRDERVTKLSGGQQRRLDMAVALAGDPKLLFLDEPTTGFDPSARRNAWEIVKNLTSLGKTVFLTTHFMDEAQYLAEHVTIMSDGVIVAQGSPRELAERNPQGALVSFRLHSGVPPLPEPLAQMTSCADGLSRLRTEDPTRVLYELTGWAIKNDVALDGLDVTRPTLEDVYLEITKEPHRTGQQVTHE